MASKFTVPPTGATGATDHAITVLGNAVPRSSGSQISKRKMPGGTVTYVDIGGPNLQTLTLTLLFDDPPTTGRTAATDALAFENLRGARGTLVVFDGTFDCILEDVQRVDRAVNTNGTTELQCVFTLL